MMNDCQEFVWEYIEKLEAIPLDGMTWVKPMPIFSPMLTAKDFTITEAKVITLLTEPGTIRAVSSVKNATNGRTYTNTISYDLLERTLNSMDQLFTLDLKAHHLRITFQNGHQALVRAGNNCYTFTHHDEDNGRIECQFIINNVSGVQTVI